MEDDAGVASAVDVLEAILDTHGGGLALRREANAVEAVGGARHRVAIVWAVVVDEAREAIWRPHDCCFGGFFFVGEGTKGRLLATI